MHPTAQRTVRKVLRQIASAGDQVFFTTHSPLLVDVTYFDEIIRVETEVSLQHGKKIVNARLFQLTIKQMLEDLRTRYPSANATEDSIREKYAHAYTSSRNEGFFAKQVILVEGQTETYCLPIYARGLGKELDMLGVAVVECQGKDSIDRLYRIFNELGIPSYVLFDYDHGNVDALDSSMSLLRFLKHEESIVAHTHNDRFSCFYTKWETAIRAETANHDTLAAEATAYFGKCSSKPLEARYIATKLVNLTPPFVPPTVKKIIEHALKVKCVGSCLARPTVPA
jgi:predicted ATP-dependent endonuclease of OLD family